MKTAIASLAFFLTLATANAAPLAETKDLGVSAGTAVQQVDWDAWHNRWRSHRRWGSGGYGYGFHSRWRSHHRWGSGGYGDGFHSRWRSHNRWGSGGYGDGFHSRWRSHYRWGSHRY